MTAIAILGAGRASRFGSGKLDAELRGQPLGQWPLQTAQRLGGRVIYVAGPRAPGFLAAAGGAVAIVTNPAPENGMGGSVALAATAARRAGATKLLVMLGDMPFVSIDTLRRLCDATSIGGAAACRYPVGALGPPACFDAELFAELERLRGDQGARSVLQDVGRTTAMPVDPEELRDVDTVADLAALNRGQ